MAPNLLFFSLIQIRKIPGKIHRKLLRIPVINDNKILQIIFENAKYNTVVELLWSGTIDFVGLVACLRPALGWAGLAYDFEQDQEDSARVRSH